MLSTLEPVGKVNSQMNQGRALSMHCRVGFLGCHPKGSGESRKSVQVVTIKWLSFSLTLDTHSVLMLISDVLLAVWSHLFMNRS